MKTYALSGAADADVRRILDHSIRQWGVTRAEQYVGQLHAAFERLAAFPSLGQDISRIRVEYRRFQHASHSVYYKSTNSGVLIIRVLHRRQLAEGRL